MIELRVLTEHGVDRFRDYLQSLKEHSDTGHPNLNIEPYSNVFIPSIKIDEARIFSSRMEMGEYLTQRFQEAGIRRQAIVEKPELWTWLAYTWFDQICPVRNGKREIRETAKYICRLHWTDYYRHYVASSYSLYSLFGRENSRLFLYNPVYEHNDFIEQLASRQFIISHPNLLKAAHRLYWDENKNRPKIGAQSRPGNHKRLIKMIVQFELTYDIYSMKANEFLDLLPEEFNVWKR